MCDVVSRPPDYEQSNSRLLQDSQAGGCPVHLILLFLQYKHGPVPRLELVCRYEMSEPLDLALIFRSFFAPICHDTAVASFVSSLVDCSSKAGGIVYPRTSAPPTGGSTSISRGIQGFCESDGSCCNTRWARHRIVAYYSASR